MGKNNWKFRLKILLNNNLTEIFIVVEAIFEINADEWVKKITKMMMYEL